MNIDKPNDFECVLNAVRKKGILLQDASSSLRNNPDIVRAAVLKDPNALKYISKELLTDKTFILSFFDEIQTDSFKAELILSFLPKKFRNDKDIVLAAVSKNGLAIRQASTELKNVKNIALAAIENSPSAFQDIPVSLRENFEIAYRAVCLDHRNLEFLIDTKLFNNTTIIYEALYLEQDAYYFISKKMQKNRVVKYLYDNVEHISESDWPVVKQALLVNPELVLKPPAAITAIFSGSTIPYLAIAQYALNHDVVFTEVEAFDFI